MTNEKIILMERFNLMNDGIIGTTGRVFSVPSADGTEKKVYEPAEIHTYQGWKSRGYQVKKGEKCKAKFAVWVPMTKKSKDPENQNDVETVKMRLKMSYWFSPSQVEIIKEADHAK